MNIKFAGEILKIRHSRSAIFPPKQKIYQFIEDLIDLLFPHYSGEYEYFVAEEVMGKLLLLKRDLKKLLIPYKEQIHLSVEKIAEKFFNELPNIYRKLWLDAQAIYEGDPAAESIDEVISAYPGFLAIYTYRIAHEFYRYKVPIFPRMLTEYAHYRTGIDIHAGAKIGDSFFIDHGTGIVIGETTVIGNHVKIYQGVSLGALSVSKALSKQKRHPTVEDRVVIYSNATILGGKTVIGHDSIIGGNVWLTESVEPFSTVYHKSEIRVRQINKIGVPINFVI
jgi:serine O-acetyltransferase